MSEYDAGFAEGYEAGTGDTRKLFLNIQRLRKSAALLLHHAEHSFDCGELPEWLVDCRSEIERAGNEARRPLDGNGN